MACEENVLDIPVSVSAPADTEYVIFTLPDGTSVIRAWSVVMSGSIPDDIDTIVTASGGTINTGDTNKTFTQLIGKRIRLVRGGVAQSQAAGEYGFNPTTGNANWTPAATLGEIFLIQPY